MLFKLLDFIRCQYWNFAECDPYSHWHTDEVFFNQRSFVSFQFIEERLDGLNSCKQTSDEFELEVSVHCEKSSSKVKQQYKQFVTNVRKEGGAIVKTMKNKVWD